MKISWGHVGVAVVSLAALAGVCRVSPALRAAVAVHSGEWLGWDREARDVNPIGFIMSVERKLKSDVARLQKCRFEMVGNTDQVSGKVREQEAQRDQARKLADEFRSAFQTARQNGSFPFVVRNASYTEEQSVAQVSLLLAQADGFDKSARRLQQIQGQANKRLQEIVVRLNATESQLAAIGAQRELLRARELTTVGEELIAQVDQLFEVNHRVLKDNPVRTVAELLSDETRTAPEAVASHAVARQFLDEIPVQANKPTVGASNPEPAKIEAPRVEIAFEVDFEASVSDSAAIQQQSTSQLSPAQK